MTQLQRTRARKKILAAIVMLLVGGLESGCGSIYYGQVAVPNTNQRLVVGHDSWPSKQIWVIEGDKVESVRIVTEDRQ